MLAEVMMLLSAAPVQALPPEAIAAAAAAPADRMVVHAGRLVASTTTTRTLADLTDLADPTPAALASPDLEGVMA